MPANNNDKEIRVVGRERGILTDRDRKYLRDEYSVESGSAHERMIRKDIRERVSNAMQDFRLLSNISEEDVEQILGEYLSPEQLSDNSLPQVIGFVYYVCAYHPGLDFESIIKRGSWVGTEQTEEIIKSINFNVETYPAGLEELVDQFAKGEDISLPEFERLLSAKALPKIEGDLTGVSLQMYFEGPIEEMSNIRVQMEKE